MQESELRALAGLIRGQRAASLGTLANGAPYVSHALYAAAEDFSAFYFHLSRLAIHTQNLRADSRAGLMISEPDTGVGDPQLLLRLSVQGMVVPIINDSPDYASARAHYTTRFPEAAPIFQLPDFGLFRFTPQAGRFVAGFGKAYNIQPGNLRLAAGV